MTADPSHPEATTETAACRRDAARVTMPVEVLLTSGQFRAEAVIRDASFNESTPPVCLGIGIFHHDALPLDHPLTCEVLSDCDALPARSEVQLMWTRQFGSDGYLSGGRLTAAE